MIQQQHPVRMYETMEDERQRLEERIRDRASGSRTAIQQVELEAMVESHREVQRLRNDYLAAIVALRARGVL